MSEKIVGTNSNNSNTGNPPVTVVCLCYNQAKWLKAALYSVVEQDYSPIQLIIVDDASTDNSKELATEFVSQYPGVTFIDLPENLGNCAAFNKALELAEGDFIIDLAADDVMLPNRITEQIARFQEVNEKTAICYSDAIFINNYGNNIGPYYYKSRPKSLVKEGNVYEALFGPNFICSPSVMFRTSHLLEAGGYDANLAYEDFDIWLRLARNYEFVFTDKVLVQKRKVSGSLSYQKFNKGNSKILESTLQICHKAKSMNKTASENMALASFVSYHLKLTAACGHKALAQNFATLLISLRPLNLVENAVLLALKVGLPLHWLVSEKG